MIQTKLQIYTSSSFPRRRETILVVCKLNYFAHPTLASRARATCPEVGVCQILQVCNFHKDTSKQAQRMVHEKEYRLSYQQLENSTLFWIVHLLDKNILVLEA